MFYGLPVRDVLDRAAGGMAGAGGVFVRYRCHDAGIARWERLEEIPESGVLALAVSPGGPGDRAVDGFAGADGFTSGAGGARHAYALHGGQRLVDGAIR